MGKAIETIRTDILASVIEVGTYLQDRQVVHDLPISHPQELAGHDATHGAMQFEPQRTIRDGDRTKVGVQGDVVIGREAGARLLDRKKAQTARLSHSSKIQRYLLSGRRAKLRRLKGYIGSRARRFVREPLEMTSGAMDHRWATHAGVNFRRTEDGIYACIDHGGIYETRLTTRIMRYPSQVGTDLYTTSYAAYLFNYLHEETGALHWHDAKERTRTYFASYFEHERQRLETDHREFDWAPIALGLGHDAAHRFRGWTDYDPVNVYGLRLYNLAVGGISGWRERARWRVARRAVRSSQLEDGLIQDNTGGGCVDCADATYHFYCLAMLCLANERMRDHELERMIDAAMDFGLRAELANGEVGYYGRAANNVYHMASWVTALCYGIGCQGKDLVDALRRAVTLLSSWQRDDGCWPTALHDADPDEMIGWHGSEAQYSALSGFLLAQGRRLLARAEGGVGPHADASRPRINESRHVRLTCGAIELGLTTGGDLVPWAQGSHESGHPGLTALCWQGRNLLLVNDVARDDVGNSLRVGDVHVHAGSRRGRLESVSSTSACLLVQGHRFRYQVHEEGLRVSWKGPGPVSCYALALIGEDWRCDHTAGSTRLENSRGLVIHLAYDSDAEATMIPVPVNPRGPGILLRIKSNASGGELEVTFGQSGLTHGA